MLMLYNTVISLKA